MRLPGVASLVILAALGAGSCGDEEPATAPVQPNRPPVAGGALPDLTVAVGDTTTVTVSFTDPDGDALTYTASSSNSRVIAVSMDRRTLTVVAVAQGSATITVTATDPGGLSARLTVPVTVPNRAPGSVGTIEDQVLFVGKTAEVNVRPHFADQDGDTLTYAASSSDSAVVSVSMAGGVAIVAAVSQGTATITVTASDPGELSAQLTFQVAVPNREPTTVGTIASRSMFKGTTASIGLVSHFTDPDGDSLTYTASSSNSKVVAVSIDDRVVTVAAVAQGTATITVTASDPGELSAQLTFQVAVPNRAPTDVGTIEDQTVFVDGTAIVDLAPYFTDPDGDSLTYAATSSNLRVASVSVVGNTLTARGLARGAVTIVVAARDPGGLTARTTFVFTVQNLTGSWQGSATYNLLSVPLVEFDLRIIDTAGTLSGSGTLSWRRYGEPGQVSARITSGFRTSTGKVGFVLTYVNINGTWTFVYSGMLDPDNNSMNGSMQWGRSKSTSSVVLNRVRN